jgi:HEAT repeat protein
VIKASSGKQIAALIADLGSDRGVTRDAAVARLTVIGQRAVASLIGVVESPGAATTRAAALRALEGIGDAHARVAILRAVDDDDPLVAATAASAARAYLRGPHGAAALDRLARTALDRSRDRTVRIAAVAAIRQLPSSTIAPLLTALRQDPDQALRELAETAPPAGRRGRPDPVRTLTAAAAGRLPDDANLLRHAVISAGPAAPLTDLLRVIEAVRDREGREPPQTREPWRAARAAAHLCLAHRGSRIAVYDLRESVAAAAEARQPVEFLAALSAVGDASCLEAIAAAHARAEDRWWRDHLAATLRAIVARERLTRRHAVIRKIEKRWPGVLTPSRQ